MLEAFLQGNLTVADLRKVLTDRFSVDIEKAPAFREMRDISLDDISSLPVTSAHVIARLDRFRLGLLEAKELSDWAALLLMLPVFVPEGETEEEQWEAGNGPVWDVLHRLAAPNVFSELTPDIARDYMELVQKK